MNSTDYQPLLQSLEKIINALQKTSSTDPKKLNGLLALKAEFQTLLASNSDMTVLESHIAEVDQLLDEMAQAEVKDLKRLLPNVE